MSSKLEPVVIELNDNDTTTNINLNNSSEPTFGKQSSVNFGGGIELLMNEKKRGGGSSADIGLAELSELENELNDLTTDINTKGSDISKSGIFNNVINSFSTTDKQDLNNGFENNDREVNLNNATNLGEQTANNLNVNKTWDGYGKVNPIPVVSDEAPMTKEELVREKFKFLRRLEDLERKGATLTKKYTMDSPLQELQGEYEMILAEREKSNSVKFQAKMLMACVTGLEFLNNKFDPFDLKMEGGGSK